MGSRSERATDAGLFRVGLRLPSPALRVCIQLDRLDPKLCPGCRRLVAGPQRLSLDKVLLVVGCLRYLVNLSGYLRLVIQMADGWSSHVGYSQLPSSHRLAAHPAFGLVPRMVSQGRALTRTHRKPSNRATHGSAPSDLPTLLNGLAAALAATWVLLTGSLDDDGPIGELRELSVVSS